MAYEKQVWEDRQVEFPNKYKDQNGNTLILTREPGTITKNGSLFSAERMNHIEDGISALDNTINSIIDLIYPVGFIISTESSTFNPNNLYTGTTWERIKGKVIVGVDEDDTDFATSGKTGGEKEHTLTNNEMPMHTHRVWWNYANEGGPMNGVNGGTRYGGSNYQESEPTGDGQPHNNMPPFYTAYMWRRTA